MQKNTIVMTSAIVLSLAVILSVFTLFASSVNATPITAPLLYYNDTSWVREDKYPIKIIDDEYYIPLTIFAQLDDTKVRVNNSLNSFVISHSGLYVSFDATTHIATDQSDNLLYIKTYKFEGNERYVPAKTVCKHLGFGYDTYTSELTGEVAIRVLDGTEELSFRSLLEIFNPDHLKTAADVSESILESIADSTEPVSTESSTPATSETPPSPQTRVLGNRIIYITLNDGIGKHTGQILDTLLAYNVKATFFISRDDIFDYPLTLARIITEGHALGIKPLPDSGAYSDFETLKTELDETNELLFRVFKTTTRAFSPDAHAKIESDTYNSIYSEELSAAGYSLWRANTPRTDGVYADARAAELALDAIWNNNTVVFDFGQNASTAYVLDKALAFIAENSDKCDVRVIKSCYTPQNR